MKVKDVAEPSNVKVAFNSIACKKCRKAEGPIQQPK